MIQLWEMGRFSKTAIILGVLFLGYLLFGFLIAPPLVRHFGERYLQDNFSPESSIERVRINPLLASVRVEGLFLADAAGTWSVAWEAAELDVSAASWVRFYPVVDVVRLESPDIRYKRQPRGAEPTESNDPAIGPTWREQIEQLNQLEIPELRIDLLEVSDGCLEFVDPTAAEPYTETMDPINFTLQDLTTVVDTEGDTAMRFFAETEAGGRLLWEGALQSQPIRSSGSFSLIGLAVQDLSPYFAERIRFRWKRPFWL